MGSGVGFPLGERLAIADYELKVSHTRRAEVGIVDLGESSVIECVPHLAIGRGRGSEAVFIRFGPHGLLARGSGGFARGLRRINLWARRSARQEHESEDGKPEQQPRSG